MPMGKSDNRSSPHFPRATQTPHLGSGNRGSRASAISKTNCSSSRMRCFPFRIIMPRRRQRAPAEFGLPIGAAKPQQSRGWSRWHYNLPRKSPGRSGVREDGLAAQATEVHRPIAEKDFRSGSAAFVWLICVRKKRPVVGGACDPAREEASGHQLVAHAPTEAHGAPAEESQVKSTAAPKTPAAVHMKRNHDLNFFAPSKALAFFSGCFCLFLGLRAFGLPTRGEAALGAPQSHSMGEVRKFCVPSGRSWQHAERVRNPHLSQALIPTRPGAAAPGRGKLSQHVARACHSRKRHRCVHHNWQQFASHPTYRLISPLARAGGIPNCGSHPPGAPGSLPNNIAESLRGFREVPGVPENPRRFHKISSELS